MQTQVIWDFLECTQQLAYIYHIPYPDIGPPPIKTKKVHQDSPYTAILVEFHERCGRGGADPREWFSNIDRDDDYHSSCGPSNPLPRGGRGPGILCLRRRRIIMG